MKKRHIYQLNLTKFEGEVASGDIAAPAAGENEGEKVAYGKVATEEVPAASEQIKEQITEPDPEARKAEFEKLIKGEYRDVFGERVQYLINERFRETKNLEKQIDGFKPLIDILGKKYGISDGNAAKLAKAIEEDDSLWEQEAMTEGLTVEQYKYQKRIEAENEMFHKQREAEEQRKGAQETYNKWLEQANEIKAQYPEFNLDTEIRHPQTGQQFLQVLQATGSVRMAYQAVNFDKILPMATQEAARRSQEETVNNIQARRSRPAESGASTSAGVIVKNDPSKWTDADMDEVIRRVSMGETIKL